MNGINGEKVDHLSAAERWLRYPALPGNPEGTGRYLLQVGNGRLFLDAEKQQWGSTRGAEGSRVREGRCGLGGKANTNPGNQNARFKGRKIVATRAIRVGEEIFVPYGRSHKFKDVMVDEWRMIRRSFYRDMG
jgi:hypothetical protein